MISEINYEKETLSRLYETNAKLCDQIEIFDAIAANQSSDATGSDRKATAIGQLRRQLEEEHEKIRNKHASSVSDETKVAQRVRDRNSEVLKHYKLLIRHIENGSYIKTAFKIEFTRAQQCDRILNEVRSLALWSLCDWAVTSEEELLTGLIQFTKSQSVWYGLSEQSGLDLDSPYVPETSYRASPRDEASDKEGIFAESASSPGRKIPERRLEESVRQLGSWNDTILGLSSPAVQETLSRELRINFSTFDVAEHQYLRSASVFLGYPDLEQVAKARTLEGHQIGISLLRASTFEKFICFLEPNDNSLLLRKAEISWQGKPPARFDTICSATYRDENVIVQWLKVDNDFREPSDRIHLMRNFSCFSEILNTSLVPLSLSSLRVLGYFEQASDLFGCVYRLPPGTSSSQQPVTLRELLDRATIYTVPDLGESFEISIALAKTIHELHIMGLVHRDIRPENIFFWPTTKSGKDPELGRPYLTGFNFGLVPRYGEGIVNNASFDLSSLGDILFEIAIWRRSYLSPTAKRASFGPKSDHGSSRRSFDDGSISMKGYVGKRYEDVVKVCLHDSFGERLGPREEDIRSYLYYFENNVVGPLAMCKA